MTIAEITDQKTWNELLLSQSTQSGIFLQSFEWGEFQKAVGRPVYRYKVDDEFAQVIELPLPMKQKYWFIPRGTIIDGLAQEARKHGALFVRFEPVSGVRCQVSGVKKTRPVSPTQTLLLDLTKTEDELLAGMHEKTRYNIRLSQRRAVSCKLVAGSHFEEFWKMMQETAKRDKFHTHPREYYEKMLTVLHNPSQPPSPVLADILSHGERNTDPIPSPSGRGQGEGMFVSLHIAYHDTTPLAAAIVGYFGDTATYLHGASSYEHRALMGPYALHWHIMQEAKKAGYRFYDFWGTTARQHAEGIARFKTGFGGTIVDYPGTFDLPLSRFWYTIYRLGRQILTG